MRDGSRLENVGVMPDEVLRPTGLALAKKTDPVLAYAALKFGANLTPEQAGGLYFMTEKEEGEAEDESSAPESK